MKRRQRRQSESTADKRIVRLLEYISLQEKTEESPGFSSVLCLTAERLLPQQFFIEESTASSSTPDNHNNNSASFSLTFRYTIPSRIILSKTEATVTLSTYMGLVDEVTTWALLLAKPQRPNRSPASSVSLQAEWGPAAHLGWFPGSIVDITSTITKTKKNLAFVRAEVRDKETGALICSASHTKYMPASKLFDGVLSPIGNLWWKVYSRYIPESTCQTSLDMTTMFDSLDFVSHTKAYFQVTSKHHNALGVGPIHEGCLSILMELVGRQVAKHAMACGMAYLDSLQTTYQSTPTNYMKVDAEVLTVQRNHSVSMRIVITSVRDGDDDKKKKKGVVISEATLNFLDSLETKARQSTTTTSHSKAMTRRTESVGTSRSLLYRNRNGLADQYSVSNSSSGSRGVTLPPRA